MSKTLIIREDRLSEIEDFLTALDEWGCDDTDARQQEIVSFLTSPQGLTQYLERSVAPVIGHA
jgi:hypothetical protein